VGLTGRKIIFATKAEVKMNARSGGHLYPSPKLLSRFQLKLLFEGL
jgi:hypothetical protein